MERKAQIWVETVIYTLIGLAVIGILLAVSKPKIDEMKDKLLIEQSIDSLNKINEKIIDVSIKGAGNKRAVELKISKGKFAIDAENNNIYWTLESKYKYSEPNTEVSVGVLKVLTTAGSPWNVKISVDYSNLELMFNGENVLKEFNEAPSPYNLYFENKGVDSLGKVIVDASE